MATKKKMAARVKKPAAPRVFVRMYRQGLGDCFLLRFPGAAGKPFHMLIDCGVVLGTQNIPKVMPPVVADIAARTGGQIDLLVATHEHWDHVSGFNQVKDQFDKIKIQQVWVAWTEDPTDALANKLRAERRGAENALRMAATQLGMAGDAATAQRVESLVSFFGAAANSTSAALDYVKKRAPGGKPRYCKPGEPPISLPEVKDFRFWVMGPPHDEKLIKKSAPSQNEAYGLDAGPGGAQAMLMAALTRESGTAADDAVEDPFDTNQCIPFGRAEQLPFFKSNYFGASTDEGSSDQSWRRIDAAWMGASETMALQLDSATNNTSLVLAIEHVPTGEVLLFPGDAQAGNWESWQTLKWEFDEGGTKKTVTGPDLLARTTFYKVGHHGSHNATLQAKGLELMVNDNLVAMIPVNHEMAVKKRWGLMPLPALVSRVKAKTHGRVLQIDDKVKTPADLATLKPADVSADDWKAFSDRVDVTELYYEFSF